MQTKKPNRIAKNFRLTKYTIAELQRLSNLLETNMTQIIEIAITQFSKSCIPLTSTDHESRT